MDALVFEKFRRECSEKLPKVIDEILSLEKEEKVGAIGFITTDDFYGFYVTWDFALTLLTTMENIIKQLPDDIFLRNNFEKENILFFSTMASGDYMQEMLDASVKMFN